MEGCTIGKYLYARTQWTTHALNQVFNKILVSFDHAQISNFANNLPDEPSQRLASYMVLKTWENVLKKVPIQVQCDYIWFVWSKLWW